MAKKICIAFPRGGIIPGKILGEEVDVSIPAMKAVEVPEAYGLHLIEDRFAVEAEMPKKVDKKAAPDAVAKAAAEDELKAAEVALAGLKG